MTTRLMTYNPNDIRQKAMASLEMGQNLLSKNYLAEIAHYTPLSTTDNDTISYGLDVRLYHISRIVLDNKQSALESLTSAYTALGSAGYTVFLLLKSNGLETDVYLGVRGQPKKNMGNEAGNLLDQVFKGHFSGSLLSLKGSHDTEKLLFGLQATEHNLPPVITAVTGVPSLSVEEREHFVQGLEKFIDAAEGRPYQALILAEPIDSQQLNLIQRGYENVATQLSPLLKQSVSFGENESESVGLSIGESISQSLGENLSLTETKGISENYSKTFTQGRNSSITEGESKSFTKGKSHSNTTSSSISKTFSVGLFGLGGSTTHSSTTSSTTTYNSSETHSTSTSKTIGNSESESKGISQGVSFSEGISKGINKTDSYAQNRNDSLTTTLGSSKQITLEMSDKSIEQLLQQVSHHLDRLSEARRYGGWHSAAYFIAGNSAESRSLGSIFLGLMRGNDSNSEDFALTTW